VAISNLTPAQIPPGEILTYYGDLASGAIRPEDVRIEDLTFRGIINAQGQVVFQTSKITVISRYTLAIRRVYVSMFNVELDGGSSSLVRFNIREQGRGFDVFKQPVSIAACLHRGPYEWDGVYMCIPGTDLEVNFTVDTTLWQSLVGATRIFDVVVSGDYIACGPTQR